MRSLVLIASLIFASSAFAGNDSTYSDFDLENKKTCPYVGREVPEEEGSSVRPIECKGYGGYKVTFAEDDLRSFVSFGKKSSDQCASHQTFGGFNSVGKKVEWRLKDSVPIATIFRWTVSYDSTDSTKERSWLVVTKVGDGNSCHIGYVEGGYPNANDKARWLADTAAEAFSCKTSAPTFFANPSTATENITSGGCEN
jgi:hypothetical protein